MHPLTKNILYRQFSLSHQKYIGGDRFGATHKRVVLSTQSAPPAIHFTARYSDYMLSQDVRPFGCLPVCLSVTRRYCQNGLTYPQTFFVAG